MLKRKLNVFRYNFELFVFNKFYNPTCFYQIDKLLLLPRVLI